ncbi:MAG TPA: LLM class flavin-dependent oxidoreductase [Thermoanaerobaculia bacterium]|nr:LLM class flavin-dependent oxidoreductase [Thermoanaerobaculia bacterium]
MYQPSARPFEIGLFQLLPAPEDRPDGEVIDGALRDVVFAEERGFDSVWIAEHHASSFGLVGAPSVYAAAVAARTRRVGIGFAVAVVPLHHPLRLAEEIAWLTHLSGGRILVGLGPGFAPFEFAAHGVPLEERRPRFEEGAAILRRLLDGDESGWAGRFWTIPPLALRPRPLRSPPFLRACSSPASAIEAARQGAGVLLGLQAPDALGETIAAYRRARSELGIAAHAIDDEVARFRVLRRVVLAETAFRAERDARGALAWEARAALRLGVSPAGTLDDRAPTAGAILGTPAAALEDLCRLAELGIRRVIAWTGFGDLPDASARRTLELLADEVIPALRRTESMKGECA